MESSPNQNVVPFKRRDRAAEAMLTIDRCLEERDVVLGALRQQLEERVIDFDLYQDRRSAYLATFLPNSNPPDISA